MDAKDITIQIKKVGGIKTIANSLGVKSPTVSQVIHGVRSNPRIRKYIASAINMSVSELWPDQEQA